MAIRIEEGGLDRPDAGTVTVGGTDVTALDEDGLVQLRRDKRRLEMENEVLRRAAGYFAKDALSR